MPFSPETSKLRFKVAQNKIQNWIAAQDRQLEQFMEKADVFTDILAPSHPSEKEESETYIKRYRALQSQLRLTTSEATKKALGIDLTDCVNEAENAVSKAILIAHTTPPHSIPGEFSTEAEIALETVSEAKRKKSTIKAVEEFFTVNERVIDSLVAFKDILEMLSKEFQEFQGPEIKAYLKQLDELLLAYQDLRLMDCIMQSDTPAEVMTALHQKISSPLFDRYADSLSELAYSQETINQRMMPYEKHVKAFMEQKELGKEYLGSLSAYTLIPVQHLPRLGMLMQEVAGRFAKESHSENCDESTLEAMALVEKSLLALKQLPVVFNERVRARDNAKKECVEQATTKMHGQNASQRKITLLKSILELNLNNPLELHDSKGVVFFDAYLKQLLVEAYPKDFSMNRALFSMNPEGPLFKNEAKRQMVLDALGIIDVKNILFNPEQFDPIQLSELYKLDKNPLWLVLKSTIPVGPNFSPAEKISVYIELAKAFYDKKIGPTEKYLGALEMAKAAYAVETSDPKDIKRRNEAFQPLLSELSDKEVRKLAEKGQLGDWIVMKHEQHAKSKDSLHVRREISDELQSLSSQKSSLLSSSSSSISSLQSAEQRSESSPTPSPRSLVKEFSAASTKSTEPMDIRSPKSKPSLGGLFSRSKHNKVLPTSEPAHRKEAWADRSSKK